MDYFVGFLILLAGCSTQSKKLRTGLAHTMLSRKNTNEYSENTHSPQRNPSHEFGFGESLIKGLEFGAQGLLRVVTDNQEMRLISAFLERPMYNKYARPVVEANKTLDVNIMLSLGRIEGLEEKNQVFATFGWLILHWHNEYFEWDPDDFGGVKRIFIDTKDLWMPEIAIINSVDDGNDLTRLATFRASILHNGSVTWSPASVFRTTCAIDLTYFPFDTQKCFINITSWSMSTKLVDFIISIEKIHTKHLAPNGEWTVKETSAGRTEFRNDDLDYTVPILYFSVKMHRRSMYYVMNIIVPSLIMATISMFVFLVPCDAGEKVSLCISVLVSYSVLLVLISDVMPKSSESVPIIGVFVTVSMVMTAVSLLFTVLILNIHHHSPEAEVPLVLRFIVFNCLCKVVCLCSNPDKKKKEVRCYVPQVSEMSEVGSPTGSGSPRIRPRQGFEDNENKSKVKSNGYSKCPENDLVANVDHSAEWRFVAKVVDRFLLLMYAVVVAVATITASVIFMEH